MKLFVLIIILVFSLLISIKLIKHSSTLFINGNIYSPTIKYECVIIKKDKIIYTGDFTSDLKYDKIVNLNGKTMLPGFIDSHTHVVLKSLTKIMIDLFVNTKEEFLIKLTTQINKRIGFNYEPLLMSDPIDLNKKILDEISNDQPLLIIHKSGHVAYFNSVLLSMINPSIIKGENNINTDKGIAYEIHAIMILLSYMLKYLHINNSTIKELTRQTLYDYAKNGYTTITDLSLGIPIGGNNIEMLRQLSKNSPVRIQGYVIYSNNCIKTCKKYLRQRSNNNPKFETLGIKIWNDGSLQAFTGALSQPYENTDNKGKLNYSLDQLKKMVKEITDNGLFVAIHANGDQAIENALIAYENIEGSKKIVKNENTNKLQHFRIEHATLTNPNLIEKMSQLNVIPSFTIPHVYYYGNVFKNILGTDRSQFIDSVKSALDHNIIFTLNDDSPLAPINPFQMIKTSMTREIRNVDVSEHEQKEERNKEQKETLNIDQKIPLIEAIKAFTINGAISCGRENEIGSIDIGKKADFVILDGENVIETWLNGKKVVMK